jgi:pyrroloquinoline quinone (PQQ) biosynthesis protein C
MDSVGSVFSEPLPPWIGDIKLKARTKIASATFAAECRHGNKAVMRGLIVGLWPFIDEFPISMIRGAARLPRSNLSTKRELLNTFLHRGPQSILSIKRDEENHRKLWLQTGKALGLRYPDDFRGSALQETQTWIDAISADCDASTVMFRFAAIEMVAEIVSVELLISETFNSILGTDGCEWFRVHAEHTEGMTHEELELKLAFALGDGSLIENYARAVIIHIVDLGVRAMDASANLYWNAGSVLSDD